MTYLYIGLVLWLLLATIGQVVLYVGYGFVQSARKAAAPGPGGAAPLSQRRVAQFDYLLALACVALDALSNLLVYSVLMLDLRPSVMFRRVDFRGWTLWVPELVTGRFCIYSLAAEEVAFRKWTADVLAAFLNGKDADHIKGVTRRFAWLD